MPDLVHLLVTGALPLNIKPQNLVLPVVLATEDLLPRLSLEPGLQPTKLHKLLHQQYQAQLLNSLFLNRLQLLLHQLELLQPNLQHPSLSTCFRWATPCCICGSE